MPKQQVNRLPLLLVIFFLVMTALPEEAQLQSNDRGQSARDNSSQSREKRVALVIGNSSYSVKPLTNPINDATDFGVALKGLGFDVTVKKDLNYKQMIQAIQTFGEQIKGSGVGLFYYAGHGAQVRGENYMIPVDTQITKEEEIPYEAVNMGWLLAQMESASNRLNIVILDACRDNPFVSSKRSSQRGLAAVTDVPVGTYISYSTAANRTASDGNGRNSPYTESLLKHIQVPGLKVEDVFKRVRNEVRAKTQGAQVPWEYSAIEGDFYFAGMGASPPQEHEPQTYTDMLSGVAIEMVRIPAGKFLMGSPESEVDRSKDEGPQREVTISQPFYMGKYEVTQLQWRAVARLSKVKIDLNPDPSRFKGDSLPVERVSWEEAVEFCERLSRATGKTYRLPTEAEWEYACRAGTTGAYAGVLDEMGWFGDNSGRSRLNVDEMWRTYSKDYGMQLVYNGCQTHRVGQKQPNRFGLYDMQGNVSEWCADWYAADYYSQSPSVDPTGPSTGSSRVLRGGSWSDGGAQGCRSAYRSGFTPGGRDSVLGFRLLRTYN